MPTIEPVYRRLCPNCGGDITASRLARGLPCTACLPEEPKGGQGDLSIEEVARELSKYRTLTPTYYHIYKLEADFKDFSEYFKSKYGFELMSAQRSWARRLLSFWRESFSIVAPTGVGKTTLLMAYAAYMAERRKVRSLYLAPTENLVSQIGDRLSQLAGNVVVKYFSSMPDSERQQALRRIEGGDFLIAVVTPGFMTKNFELLKKHSPYELVIVDDVDSLLRNSKNIDRVLELMGFSDEIINSAYEVVKLTLDAVEALSAGATEKANKLFEEVQAKRSELNKLFSEQLAQGKTAGQLVIASATGRPKGVKHLVFRELLGFEVGSGTDYLRDVVDSYVITDDVVGKVVGLVKELGPGGLVFVSQAYGRPFVKVVLKALQDAGVAAVAAISSPTRAVRALVEGKAAVAVGVASRYGALVRGIDLPTIIKYAVFVGVPAVKVELRTALLSPRRLLRALEYAESKDPSLKDYEDRLEKLLRAYGSESRLRVLAAAVRGELEVSGALKELKDLILEASPKVADIIEAQLQNSGDSIRIGTMVVRREGDTVYLYSPDQASYIQASGRTSRLFSGHMTKGLSIIVDVSEDLVKALQERLRWTSQAVLTPLSSIDLNRVVKELEESRRPDSGKNKINVVTELIVVESPTKAKTIANFWGRPARRREGNLTLYETTTVDPETNTVHLITVTASKGHVFDLAEDPPSKGYMFGVKLDNGSFEPVYTSIKRCLSCGYQFTEEANRCPRCGSPLIVDSRANIESLKRVAMEVDRVIIMTDPDREGEKIAWDLYLALRPYNRNIYRSAFHEVTLSAFMEALRSPGPFNENMVKAQIVRRIDDRWIGFVTSQYLWAMMNMKWLGAGRVQTPVLGWVLSRYDDYKKNMGFKVRVTLPSGTAVVFYTNDKSVYDEVKSLLLMDEQGRTYAKLRAVTEKLWSEDINPMPPYTTDELIYDASIRLGFSAETTMRLAQDLFYSGLITYHRTDSTRISEVGMGVARQYLESHGMAQYFKPRSWGTGGAHEAIRPTRPLNVNELQAAILDGSLRVPMMLSHAHYALYQLIFERFIASQMTPATVRKASVTLSLGPLSQSLEVITAVEKEGFTLVYRPKLETWVKEGVGKEYELGPLEARTFRGSTVSLFRSGDVVMLMKQRGIGRPSTYAKIIDSIKRHGYVIETKRLKLLVPTSRGRKVYELLMSSPFAPMLTEEQSKLLEDTLDKIESGEARAEDTIQSIYDDITKRLEASGFRLNI